MTFQKGNKYRFQKGKNNINWKGGISLDKRKYYETKKDYDKRYFKKYREINREELVEKNKEYNRIHSKERVEYNRKWKKENPEKLKEQRKRWREGTGRSPKHRLNKGVGTAIYYALKGKKAGRGWETLVGYTLKDLMKHLEQLFDDKMNWNNYGFYWHVDHRKPQSLFKYISTEDPEFKKCWALSNLQPLERIENMKKGDKYCEV